MVNASAVSRLLLIFEMRAHGENNTEDIFIFLDDLKQMDLSVGEANEALHVLANDVGYECINLFDDKSEKGIWIGIDLLPNFNETRQAFLKYINYVRNEAKANERFPNEDWQELKERFHSSTSNVYWGQDGVRIEPRLRRVPENYNTTLRLIGNDVVMEFTGNEYTIIKTLRTDQAPFYFLKYLMLHPDQVIPRGVIQSEVEQCKTKNDMTELVRQCGFGKELKNYFFKGTTKDKVRFTPHANTSFQTAFEGET
jgi:hypothetical protein